MAAAGGEVKIVMIHERPTHEAPAKELSVPIEGPLAFLLLGLVGFMGTDITPTRYYPDLSHYIPRYVVLAISIGLAVGAIRRGNRQDRVIGIAVLVVGVGMASYIVKECLMIIS